MTTILGWCAARQHTRCPGHVPAYTFQDPARKGATYTTNPHDCGCSCHERTEHA